MQAITEGALLWEPPDDLKRSAILTRYMAWLRETRGLDFADYQALWQWTVTDIEGFWGSLWEFFAIQASQPYERVLSSHAMPGAHWFPGARLSYAEHIFRRASPDRPAILFQSELQPPTEVSWATLQAQVAAVAAALRGMDVRPGDRVVAYLPNIPQAVVAFLACACVGAVWSSCSPDFGSPSVIDRFKQIQPRVLFAVDGYRYGGKDFDRRAVVDEIVAALPTLGHVVTVPYLHERTPLYPPADGGRPEAAADTPSPSTGRAGEGSGPAVHTWDEALTTPGDLRFEQLPFEHPLWVLYSSGTTGLPKPLVHGQGGILLEHLKVIHLHSNIAPGDRFFWYTSTGWMMWNYLVGGLLAGATILLYDGSPGYPDMGVLWQFAAATHMNVFGTSAPFIVACMKAGIAPGKEYDLSALRSIGSTGAPLPPEGFAWIYDSVKPDIWLASISGGTDVCTGFVKDCPILPVHAGELQCLALGAKVEAWDEEGKPLVDQVGELVITEPMPSMPIYFWNDPDGQRYLSSYFTMYPGVWRHGDWIKITPRGSAVIYGRSDSTLNRMGVRMGTSEFYSVVESLPEVMDSLVIDLEEMGQDAYMPLFVVLRPGVDLDETLKARIKARIRDSLSPRHVPDEIIEITEVPRTLNGKKMEVPIKKILMGAAPDKAANPDSMANPGALRPFIDLAMRRQR